MPDSDARPLVGAPSANDRFKDRWSTTLRRSALAAVAFHAGVLAATHWSSNSIPVQSVAEGARSLRVLPAMASAASFGGTELPTVPAIQEAAPVEVASDLDPGRGEVPGMGEVWEALERRMRGRAPVRATLAEPVDPPSEPPIRPTASEGDSEGDPGIDANAITADLSIFPEADSLALDRLANLEPELALAAASAWVLIRNPVEVQEYLRGSVAWGRLPPDAAGSVAVNLWIDENGVVEWAEISRSSGTRAIDELALAMFNEVAKFRPARDRGVRISRSVSLALNFPW